MRKRTLLITKTNGSTDEWFEEDFTGFNVTDKFLEIYRNGNLVGLYRMDIIDSFSFKKH